MNEHDIKWETNEDVNQRAHSLSFVVILASFVSVCAVNRWVGKDGRLPAVGNSCLRHKHKHT